MTMAQPRRGSGRSRRPAPPPGETVRRCLVSRESLPRERLVRFVVAPDGSIVPDIEGSLPGRGFWLSARRDMVDTACERNLFAKAAEGPVRTPADLAGRIEVQLARRCVEIIGLARRAGQAVAGSEKAAALIRKRGCGALIVASDAAPNARGKVAGAAQGAGLVDVLSAAEVGGAFGRDHIVHAAVAPGRLAEELLREAGRLAGFRQREVAEALN